MKSEAYIVFVFDQSGSMGMIAHEAIDNYNKFIDEQKQIAQKASFRLILFNTVVKTHYEGDLALTPHLDGQSYRPDGWTALYDAMADAITETGGLLAAMPEQDRPRKVIVATMTDGQENSSQRFMGEEGRERLAAMINHQQQVYSWEFIFLGANIDAKQVATSLNIPVANTTQWDATREGTQRVFAATSNTMRRMRTS